MQIIDILRSRDARYVVAVSLATGALYYFGVLFALTFVNPVEKIAFFWPSNAIAAAVLVIAPRRNWPAILSAVVVGYMAARGPAGGLPLSVLAGFCAANLFECSVVALLFRASWKAELQFADLAKFLPFLVMACAVAAVLSGIIGAFVVAFILEGATFIRAFVVWFTSDLCGLMLVLPVLIAVLVPDPEGCRFAVRPVNHRAGIAVAAALLAAVVGLYLWLPEGWRFSLLAPYLILAALIWVALEINLFWTIVGTVVAGVTEVTATFVGFELFHFEGMSVTDEVVLMKAAIGMMTLGVLLFAARCEIAREERLEVGT